jgi:transposase-like protein
MEADVNGVSTRKVERLVEQLGVEGMSRSQVSRICRGLDERAEAVRSRPLEGAYPYLWLDARIERCATATPTPCATRRCSWPTASTRQAGAR